MPDHESRPALSVDNGVALVAFWISCGLAIWLLASLSPSIDAWLKSNQHLSGWAQFVGGVLAIIAAWLVGRMQIAASLAAERERDRQHRLRHLQASYLAFSNAIADAEIIGKVNMLDERGPQEVARLCREISSELLLVVQHELPPALSSQLSSVRAVVLRLAAAVQQVKAWTRKEQIEVYADAALVRRIAYRGQSLAWAALGRTMSVDEIREEVAWRDQVAEHHRNNP